MAHYRTLWFYLCLYLIFAATALRGLADFFSNGWPQRWWIAALLAAVGGLLLLEPGLTRRGRGVTMCYLGSQAVLIFALGIQPPFFDYFSLLYVILSAQAIFLLPQRSGLLWIGVFTALSTVALFYGHGWPTAVPFVLIYAAAYLFVGSYARVVNQAETARRESQTLLAELQSAHRQLQRYADQVKSLTVIEERQRLARDLHDSVTHTLFSINFTAEAARLLLHQNPAALERPLAQLQSLAQSALAELRALIGQLRPLAAVDAELAPALRHHLAALAAQQGLTVDLQIAAEPTLSAEQGEQILRIIQEALHNVVKHAQTQQAGVALQQVDGRLVVIVSDQGVGFIPAQTPTTGPHLGLISMRERAAALGGSLVVDAGPGAGTRVTLTVPLPATLPVTLSSTVPKEEADQ